MYQSNKKNILISLIATLLVVAVAGLAHQTSAPQPYTGKTVPFMITQAPWSTDTVTGTSHELFWSGLVKNERLTDVILFVTTFAQERPFEPGIYHVPKGLNTFQVLKKLRGTPDEPLPPERLN